MSFHFPKMKYKAKKKGRNKKNSKNQGRERGVRHVCCQFRFDYLYSKFQENHGGSVSCELFIFWQFMCMEKFNLYFGAGYLNHPVAARLRSAGPSGLFLLHHRFLNKCCLFFCLSVCFRTNEMSVRMKLQNFNFKKLIDVRFELDSSCSGSLSRYFLDYSGF